MRQAAIWGFWEVNGSDELGVFKRPEFEVPPNQWRVCHIYLQCPPDWKQGSNAPETQRWLGAEAQTELPEKSPYSGLRSEKGTLKTESAELLPLFFSASPKPQPSSNPQALTLEVPAEEETFLWSQESGTNSHHFTLHYFIVSLSSSQTPITLYSITL